MGESLGRPWTPRPCQRMALWLAFRRTAPLALVGQQDQQIIGWLYQKEEEDQEAHSQAHPWTSHSSTDTSSHTNSNSSTNPSCKFQTFSRPVPEQLTCALSRVLYIRIVPHALVSIFSDHLISWSHLPTIVNTSYNLSSSSPRLLRVLHLRPRPLRRRPLL